MNEEVREQGFATIKAWRKAAGRLHQKSLEQQVRNKMVAEEGAGVLAFDEEHSPAQLMSIYDYGDLLHWDRGRNVLAQWDEDEFRAGERRLAFLAAACALAHLYIGFAVLAATATGRSA